MQEKGSSVLNAGASAESGSNMAYREPRVDFAFGSFSATWSLLSSLRGRLLPAPPSSMFPTTEEDRLRLNEVSEGVPTDSEPDGDDNPWMNEPVGG